MAISLFEHFTFLNEILSSKTVSCKSKCQYLLGTANYIPLSNLQFIARTYSIWTFFRKIFSLKNEKMTKITFLQYNFPFGIKLI